MIVACRNCKHSTIGEFDKEWKVKWWYCPKKREMIPDFVMMTCKEFEPYESNLHVDNAARPNPQTRDNGIHQEE